MDRYTDTIRRPRQGERGFSLVEILIAIAVLIVGIVAVLEMFPPGFEALSAAETRTLAQNMASDVVNRTSASLSQINLIYSETNYFEDNTTWTRSWPVPTTSNPYGSAGPNSELVVSGETATIPKLNTSVISPNALITPLGTGGSTYGLCFSPIYLNSTTSDGPTIRGENWTVLSGSAYMVGSSYSAAPSTGTVDVPPVGLFDPTDALTPNQPQCEVDFTNGKIALPLEYCYFQYNTQVRQSGSGTAPTSTVPGGSTNYSQVLYPQTFQITITTTNRSTLATTTYTGSMTINPADVTYTPGSDVDPTYHSLWFDPTALPGASSVTWSGGTAPAAPWTSVTIRRDYQAVASFTSDPYQFILDANIGSATQVNPGVLHFNPWATTLRDAQNNMVTFIADYKMADTHILCEDHAATSDSIRVDAPAMMQLNDPIDAGDGGGTYAGLINPSLNMGSPSAPAPDVLVYDMDTGTPLLSGTDYYPNYSAGRISLSTTYARTNAHLRVFYCARHIWSASVTKSASSYTVYPDTNSGSSGGVYSTSIRYDQEIPPDLGRYWIASDSGSTRLYFPYTDIGKTISIGILTVTEPGGASTRTIAGAGNWMILAPDSTMTAATAGGTQMGYIDFSYGRTPDGNPPGILNTGEYLVETSPKVGPATNVNCASVNVRITYMQNNSWRHQDVTSFVNPRT